MMKKKYYVPRERGVKLIHNPMRNKGTAFTSQERDILGLRGLLPPREISQEEQAERIMRTLRKKPDDLERYIYLTSLQDRNEHLFYRVLTDHLEEIMPIIYTPTVGLACQNYGHIYRRSRGLYLSWEDRGHFRRILRNWPHSDVRVLVITDGRRILGLGDLGVNGMGIPIGKLALYTACAGIHPASCLPVMLDVGTNNEALLGDASYLGLLRNRITDSGYEEVMDEFVDAVQEVFPAAMIQLEDFGTHQAFSLLNRYRNRVCLFDDDIQGTAAVALAGMYSAMRMVDGSLSDQRYVFLGAGEAGIGIGHILVSAMQAEGLSETEARQRCWFVDSKGLVVASRTDLADHKLPFAHESAPIRTFHEAVRTLKPTAIIGVSGQHGQFTPDIIREMSTLNTRPIIFALSNPTANSECTAEEAYTHSDGRAIFASGSPFEPVHHNGRTFYPGQGNNAYIFPGVGLGTVFSRSRLVTDQMFMAAAKVVADCVTDEERDSGMIFPRLSRIREVSARIAAAVAKVSLDQGLSAAHFSAEDPLPEIEAAMFSPEYTPYF